MPRIKTSRTKPPPEGFDELEEVVSGCFEENMFDGGSVGGQELIAVSAMALFSSLMSTLLSFSPTALQLDEYQRQMRDAETESHEGKRKDESVWPIMRITHTRSRWIYELYYKREAISQELYDWLCDEKYADAK